jgi:hypothetical protein
MVSWTCLETTTTVITALSHMSTTIKKVTNRSASEIDDIFTRKAGAVAPKANPHNGLEQKRRKKKTTKSQLAEQKRPPPQVILDPSTTQNSTPKTTSYDRPVPPRKRQKVDQDKFKDSRGTGPRERISCPCRELR